VIKEWKFVDDDSRCSFRTAGILIRNNKAFLMLRDGQYFVPGGTVNFGETAEMAIIREFKEEIGVDITCQRLIRVEEFFTEWDNKAVHGISFTFFVSLIDDSALPDGFTGTAMDDSKVTFEWVALDSSACILGIKNISPHIEHLVRRS